MKIISYPDGGKYVINDLNERSIIYRINDYSDLFLLKSIKEANPFLEEITIPCMFQQQHDRKFNDNESFELKIVCDFINSCGFKKVNIFHPHSDVTPALINNSQVINNHQFITKVLLKIRTLDNLVLMSADAGGYKPLISLAGFLEWDETYSATKSRDPKTHKLTQLLDKQDFQGKDILIIDDICVYGGTFKGLSKLLDQKNCGKKYLAVSHITVQNLGDDPVTDYFDKVYTTNSKFPIYNHSKNKMYGEVPDNLKQKLSELKKNVPEQVSLDISYNGTNIKNVKTVKELLEISSSIHAREKAYNEEISRYALNADKIQKFTVSDKTAAQWKEIISKAIHELMNKKQIEQLETAIEKLSKFEDEKTKFQREMESIMNLASEPLA